MSSADESCVASSSDSQRRPALNSEDRRHLPAAGKFLRNPGFERWAAYHGRSVYIVPAIRTATAAVAFAIVWILEVHAVQELISVRIVDTMRPGIVRQHAKLLREALLNSDQTGVVVGIAATIGLDNARVVFAGCRIQQI